MMPQARPEPPRPPTFADLPPWLPDRGDGTYRNPVLHADYSDPDVIRVNDDFYLIASSFHCTPGLPLLHSRDLVNWSIIGHALENLPHDSYDEVRQGHGVYAPMIRHHAGLFWIVFPLVDHGIYVTTAPDIRGPWSAPHALVPGKGLIDPCVLWDDDGRTYLVHAYAKSRSGIRNRIHVRPISPDCRTLLGEGRVVISIDERLPALEGPKWLRRNGWYYISAPSGGVATGWQTVFRSREVYGPYEERVVLAQRGTPVNGPHQGAFVDTPGGEWWFLHFQDMDLYGRVVHLQPVRWEDDWPLVGVDQDAHGVGAPAIVGRKPRATPECRPCAPQASDDFSARRLGPQWQWNANHRRAWHSLGAVPGRLRLFAQFAAEGRLAAAPHLLLQKFPAREFTVETELDLPADQPHVHAGLVVVGGNHAALDLRRESGTLFLRLVTTAETGAEEAVVHPGPIRLRLVVGDGGGCRFGHVTNEGGFHQLGAEFFVRAGVWVGAKFGLYVTTPEPVRTGHADFSWVRVLPGTLPATTEREVASVR